MPDERCIAHENVSFLWSWTPRRGFRSAAIHAPLCNWVASDNLSPKLDIFLALKGLIDDGIEEVLILQFAKISSRNYSVKLD